MEIAIVVPTNRPVEMVNFMHSWQPLWNDNPHDITLIVVEDNDSPTSGMINTHECDFNVLHYCRMDIINDNMQEFIPFKSDGIRNYGYIQAFKIGSDIIVTFDDDVRPFEGQDAVLGHIANLIRTKSVVEDRWETTLTGNYRPRGLPYQSGFYEYEVYPSISHGLWMNNLDYDAPTQLTNGNIIGDDKYHVGDQKIIKKASYYPMCGMNLAWVSDMTPAMYFPPMGELNGEKMPYNRFADIWCGIISKLVCDATDRYVVSGEPVIDHSRASNVFNNLVAEAEGIRANEHFWKIVDSTDMTRCHGISHAMHLIASRFLTLEVPENEVLNTYLYKLSFCIELWLKQFQEA